jgi:hypothetical protein
LSGFSGEQQRDGLFLWNKPLDPRGAAAMPRYERNYTGEKRTEFLGFQLTPSERRQIEDAAKEAGVRLSDWARDLLLARSTEAAMLRARRRNPEAAAIMRALDAAASELNAAGNNLNQIARHLNTTGELRDWGELRETLALFEKGEAQHMAAIARVLAW